MRTRLASLLTATVLMFPAIGSAHEIAIIPQEWQKYKVGQEVPFGVVATHAFPKSEELEDPASVYVSYLGKQVPLDADKAFLQYEGKVKLDKAGAAMLRAHRKPEIWSNTPRGWLKGGRDQHKNAIFTHKYEKFGKTLLPVDGKTEGFDAVVGDKIEIVPVDNPLTARPGDEIRVRFLLDGKPFTPERVVATYDGFSDRPNTWAFQTEPSGDGTAIIKLSAPGLWVIRIEHLDKVANESYDAHNLRSTLVFPVK